MAMTARWSNQLVASDLDVVLLTLRRVEGDLAEVHVYVANHLAQRARLPAARARRDVMALMRAVDGKVDPVAAAAVRHFYCLVLQSLEVAMQHQRLADLRTMLVALAEVRSGWEDLVVAGGLESMSRVPIGSDGGAWAQDPETNSATLFVPQGIGADLIATLSGFSRHDVDAFAVESQKRATAARAAGYFNGSVVPVKDKLGQVILAQDEFIKPSTTVETLGGLKASFEQLGAMGFDAVALQRYPQVERITMCTTLATRPASWTAQRRC